MKTIKYIAAATLATVMTVGIINTASADSKAWVTELTYTLTAAESRSIASVKVPHCGSINRSDLSIAFGRVYGKGQRVKFNRPQPMKGKHYWWAGYLIGNKWMMRKMFFPCHHIK